MTPNLVSFLSMIAFSEGTKDVGHDGYDVLVGSTPKMPLLFGSYADHPRAVIRVRKDNPVTAEDEELLSSAAGRYQILARIFDAYAKPLHLPDFSPDSQDRIAIQLITECGAVEHVNAGRFEKAVELCRSRWASLPGAGYNQRERSMLALRTAYVNFGGILS